MSFIKVGTNNFEYSGLELHPDVLYTSSSLEGAGITGSVYVQPLQNKAVSPVGHNAREQLEYFVASGQERNISVGRTSPGRKEIKIIRFDPPHEYTKNSAVKNYVRNVLMPHHSHRYQNCAYSYGNYNSLNFLADDNIPGDTAIAFANNNNIYDLNNPFCLSFWINPKYSTTGEYNAGTIFHLSSSIAVSIVSGSSRNERDEVDTFKILLQLSQSADLNPTSVDLNQPSGNYPNDLIYTSSHSLKKDHWHNVTIQWGNVVNDSSGSLFIDDNETNFAINSSSLASQNSPKGLVIGNYFDSTAANLENIFGDGRVSGPGGTVNEGFTELIGSAATYPGTVDFFNNPLNAEIHEVKLFNRYFPDTKLYNRGITHLNSLKYEGIDNFNHCQFYLGPMFYSDTPERELNASPYLYSSNLTGSTPFNREFALRTGGKILNLENFVVDLKNQVSPRLINMFPDLAATLSNHISADEYVYGDSYRTKRNLSILPCDNGLFKPSYRFYEQYTDFNDYGRYGNADVDYSIVNLSNSDVNLRNDLHSQMLDGDGFFDNSIMGALGTQMGPNPIYTGNSMGFVSEDNFFISFMTQDVSSNEVVFFDISNLYYGNAIKPGSFEIYDNSLTGSDGAIGIRLKDNGYGSLYRSDCKTKVAEWNNVGNIFYEEGLVLIKSPHLVYYGKDYHQIKFKGEQNIHTMIINVPAYKNMFNSSSNPTYVSDYSADKSSEVREGVYITSVNIHDNNFNIIMRANFAQPIVKTKDDEFIIRLKEDF